MNKEYELYASNEEFVEKIISDKFIQKISEQHKLTNSREVSEIVITNLHIVIKLPNIKVPGTDVILYEGKDSMCQKLWEEFEKFNFAFKLANIIISNLIF